MHIWYMKRTYYFYQLIETVYVARSNSSTIEGWYTGLCGFAADVFHMNTSMSVMRANG
jgi:hypothetical protein